ncbi:MULTISPECIES: hypothetical protein [Enterococcus]|uniref:hypothetical protein n=1 Tax=Enterococcus TaxID=1350 RepID=UPI000A39BC94|nr:MULTISPECIES: hypothetical protein [Enterococcus]MDB1689835.1 hypothetical protein [Enterococcus casseliflavus]MDO7880534.1 hypothetical protein [Enterococcus mundtii]OTO14148.1 hypothetical protein A5882_002573 [Enterococcus sp. 4E1_DIV0656]
MLKTNKSTSVNGQVMIDKTMVVYLSASIDEDKGVSTSPSISIQEPDLYQKNKKTCREGIQEFLKELWALEDKA